MMFVRTEKTGQHYIIYGFGNPWTSSALKLRVVLTFWASFFLLFSSSNLSSGPDRSGQVTVRLTCTSSFKLLGQIRFVANGRWILPRSPQSSLFLVYWQYVRRFGLSRENRWDDRHLCMYPLPDFTYFPSSSSFGVTFLHSYTLLYLV